MRLVPLLLWLGLAAQVRAEPTPRAVAGQELRQWHQGDGHRYSLSRRPVYAADGIAAWRIFVNGRAHKTAVLTRNDGGRVSVVGMAEIAQARPGAGSLDSFRIGGRYQSHERVVRAQGVFRPTLALILLTPANAVVEPITNARLIGATGGSRGRSFLFEPTGGGDDLALRVTGSRGSPSTIVVAPF